jgi:dTMP kinase
VGLFITFEGGEGCGKTYQSQSLYRKLQNHDIPVILTYEPGGTILGNAVRRLLKKQIRDLMIFPESELFLFIACRIQLIAEVIRPSLQDNKVVLCDRFSDSTMVYQGFGRGIDLKIIRELHAIATKNLKPDLTILLDVPVEVGLIRKKDKNKDRFDSAEFSFHVKVKNGFLALAKEEPERWMVIDATLPKADISNIIWRKVSALLASHGYKSNG